MQGTAGGPSQRKDLLVTAAGHAGSTLYIRLAVTRRLTMFRGAGLVRANACVWPGCGRCCSSVPSALGFTVIGHWSRSPEPPVCVCCNSCFFFFAVRRVSPSHALPQKKNYTPLPQKKKSTCPYRKKKNYTPLLQKKINFFFIIHTPKNNYTTRRFFCTRLTFFTPVWTPRLFLTFWGGPIASPSPRNATCTCAQPIFGSWG